MDDFLWGVAISSHQNEGCAPASDWAHGERANRFPQRTGAGAGFREHWPEDLDRIRDELGGNAIRLSIEWARVEPEPGKFDAEELAYLHRLFAGARERGLAVIATLHHFTSPQWIHAGNRSGWENRATAEAFARYVRVVARELGPYVRYWITFNEPANILLGGHLSGRMPPFRKGPLAFVRALRTVAEAHERAYDAIHELVPGAMVSVSEYTGVLNLGVGVDYQPGRIFDLLWQRDAGKLKHFDFMGLHYYGDIPPWELSRFPLEFEKFGVRPARFGKVLRDAWARYKLPILIGENGLATRNHAPRRDGWTADRYMEAHVAELRAAAAAGVPLLGYCWWTLTDNYEWGAFDSRFGLYRVECAAGDYTRHATPAVATFKRLAAEGLG